MVQLILLVPPVLILVILNSFKKIVGDFEVSSLGMDLHVNGIMYLLPLPLIRHDQTEILLIVLMMSTVSLIITATCHAGARRKLSRQSAGFSKIAFMAGAFFFFFGLAMMLLLT